MKHTKQNAFYITTPLYYVNAKPHIGTLYSTLLADVAARWQRFSGDNVLFLTGTDEHGQKMAEQAVKADVTPKQFVDKMAPAFQNVWKQYAISYDQFIRTTDFDHKQAVTTFIELLKEKGDIYKASYEGLYCVPCETFVTQEQVYKEEDASLCPSCHRGLEVLAEENYFFRLSAYEEQLLAYFENNPNFIQPKERANEIISFVRSGLRDLSISRKSVSWGIPFPDDPEHCVYVWADALLNYISALGFGKRDQASQEKMSTFWPANVQVMAKDIVKFHAVYFPAFLFAAGMQPASKLLVHGYILVDNDKMSKSKGNACDPVELAQSFGVDPLRYYLIRHIPINHDGNFSLPEVAQRIGSDLANALGNLLQRTTSLALKYGVTEVAAPREWSEKSRALRAEYDAMLQTFSSYMDEQRFSNAYAELWRYIALVNAYFHEQQPWVLAKTDGEAFKEVVAAAVQSLYGIAHLIAPVMPYKAKQLLAALGHTILLDKNQLWMSSWDVTCTLFVPKEPLFVRPDVKKFKGEDMSEQRPAEQAPEKVVEKKEEAASTQEGPAQISIDDFCKVDLVVGKILSCEAVPKSKKLLCLQVDMGDLGQRQVLSGISQFFEPDDLVGKKVVFVANLAPRKMMGKESHGMLLTAEKGDALSLVMVGDEVEPGARLK